MINTVELEKRWIKYKTRIFSSLFFILFFIIAIPYLSFYLFEQYNRIIDKDENISKMISKNKLLPKVENNVTKDSVVDREIIVDKNSNDVMLSPSIPIIDFNKEKQKDRDIEVKKIEQKRAKEDKNRKAKERAYHQKVAKRRALKRKRELAKKELKKRKLIKAKASSSLSSDELKVVSGEDIKKSHKRELREPREAKKIHFGGSSSNYMPIMKKKFEENRNPREAILIATAYYKAGNYIESEKWALTANNLDKENEESWFLFAKSKAKLGKRKEALTILVSYHKKTKSSEAKELIEKIKGGSF